MSCSNICSSCSGIFDGQYVPTNLVFQPDNVEDADDRIETFTTDQTEWRVRIVDASDRGLPRAPYLHHTLHALAESASSCVLCAMMCEGLQLDRQIPLRAAKLAEWEQGEESLFGIPIVRPKKGAFCGAFSFGMLYATFEGQTLSGRFFRFFHMFKAISIQEGDNRQIWKPKFDREHSLSRLRSWLDTSETTSSLPPRLPSRLLLCRPSTTAKGNPEVRLVDSQTLETCTRYAALSHRWGEVRPIMLIQALKDAFYKEIAFGSIPATFQDAIKLANALGIEYVWIDSLCIIQDSEQDWQTEAAHMASVYSQAHVTISATAAENSAAGLTRQQSSMLKQSCEIMPSWTGFSKQEIPPGPVRIIDRGAFCDNVLSQPLFGRGWVFQEWILSPKTIHFARDQLWWTSASSMKLQGFAANETCEGYDFEVTRDSTHLMAPGTLYSIQGQSIEMLQQVWNDLLQDYMSRSLTYESDRLVAFAGIAALYQSFAQVPSNSYLAGIWRQTLLQSLMWNIRDGRKISPPQKYRAPSWSWASVEPEQTVSAKFSLGYGYMSADDDLIDRQEPWIPTTTVLDASVTTATGSEFGPVSGGYLALQGPLIKARLCMVTIDLSDRLTPEQAAEFVPGGRLRYVRNFVALSTNQSMTMEEADATSDVTRAQLDAVVPTSLPEETVTIYLAVLYYRMTWNGTPVGHALALVRGLGKGEFRRVGYVYVQEDILSSRAKDGDFGGVDTLTSEDYLSIANQPGMYSYRIV
ncbi:hypothetical protein F66182_3133 [Fusarium sp. NRRL 66182]|nr:hypothetical protein F66182_3133 [Fusarium sp. NRRL 66182]